MASGSDRARWTEVPIASQASMLTNRPLGVTRWSTLLARFTFNKQSHAGPILRICRVGDISTAVSVSSLPKDEQNFAGTRIRFPDRWPKALRRHHAGVDIIVRRAALFHL